MILWCSHDNGELYLPEQIDEPDLEFYTRYQVPDTFTLKAEDVTGHDGSLLEVLLAAGVAEKVE